MQPCQYRYHVIIAHPREARVLVMDGPDGLHLPSFTRDEFALWSDVRPVNRAMAERFGCRFAVIRCLRIDAEGDLSAVDFFHAGEVLSHGWRPPDSARWVGPDELDVFRLALPHHRAVIDEWFAWLGDASRGDIRAPWYRNGWMASAADWVREQVVSTGAELIGEVEQVRATARAAILRADTTDGAVYLKAVPSVFAHEPAVIRTIAASFPRNLPEIVVHDREQYWFLLRDLGSACLVGESDIDAWADALGAYARMQIHTAGRVDDLLALGCPDKSIGRILTEIDDLVSDRDSLQLGGAPGGLTDREIESLHDRAPCLKSMLTDMTSYRVPHGIEHGDLWGAQIIRRDGAPVFIDWSDCSVSHPFFSPYLYIMTEEVGAYMSGRPGAADILRDAYLERWTVYEPMHRLRELFELAGRVAGLHFALLYYRIILPSIETKWEWRLMLPFLLRRLLNEGKT